MSKNKKKVIILGAGITGLATAYYLSKDFEVTVLEKEKFIGGTATSFEHNGFVLDFGPHKLYTELQGIIEEIAKITNLIKIKKKNSIYLQKNYFDFPLKISQVATKMPVTALKTGIDILIKPLKKHSEESYEDFLINRFGKTLYELSFKDYAFKIWNSDPKQLDSELARKRVAVSGIFQLIKSVLFKDNKQISAEYFYYPKKGMAQFFKDLEVKLKKSKVKIIKSSKIKEINILDNKINYIKFDNKKIKPDFIISTIPLDDLAVLITPQKNIPLDKLRYQKLNIIYFFLNKQRALNDCWIFFPEKKFIFQRISEQKAFSPFTSPQDKTALMVETTKNIAPLLISEIIKQLEEIGILKKSEIKEYLIKTLNKAYPIYKIGYKEQLKETSNLLESIENFYLIGRQGLFNYNNMDQCWDMAMKISEQIRQNKSKEEWKKTKDYFNKYRIVD